MSFADWKKQSEKLTRLFGRVSSAQMAEIDGACKAAYMAGYRNGRKDAEAVAKNAVELVIAIERGTKAWADVPNATEFVEDLRSNAKLNGGP
jgi:hypothetical protein